MPRAQCYAKINAWGAKGTRGVAVVHVVAQCRHWRSQKRYTPTVAVTRSRQQRSIAYSGVYRRHRQRVRQRCAAQRVCGSVVVRTLQCVAPSSLVEPAAIGIGEYSIVTDSAARCPRNVRRDVFAVAKARGVGFAGHR